mmetsp:Transcript_15548/g.32365  ORF Transcript_15548/g.32365 Transcript_15548/m.32365 type:complete len:200 (-) Transcript_15548:1690-2289(-)
MLRRELRRVSSARARPPSLAAGEAAACGGTGAVGCCGCGGVGVSTAAGSTALGTANAGASSVYSDRADAIASRPAGRSDHALAIDGSAPSSSASPPMLCADANSDASERTDRSAWLCTLSSRRARGLPPAASRAESSAYECADSHVSARDSCDDSCVESRGSAVVDCVTDGARSCGAASTGAGCFAGLLKILARKPGCF